MVEVEVVEGDRQTERAREAAAGQIISLSLTVVALSLSLSHGSACPRNKVVPSNCSNGVPSSLDS